MGSRGFFGGVIYCSESVRWLARVGAKGVPILNAGGRKGAVCGRGLHRLGIRISSGESPLVAIPPVVAAEPESGFEPAERAFAKVHRWVE